MNNYVIITDCTCDLSMDIIQKYDIPIIPMEFTLDNEKYLHTADFSVFREINFYDKLKNGSTAATSQINPYTYNEFFTPYLEEGKDILYVCFSSGLSSTYQSSMIAIAELKEKYPDRKIISVDSLGASAGEGLMTLYAYLNKEKGMSIEENAAWLQEHVQNFAHWFTVDDLHHLKRGGRISAATAIVGSALNIKPILRVDEEGHLVSVSKAHGRKKSLSSLANKLAETIKDPEGQVIMISHGNCVEDATFLKEKILEVIPNIQEVVLSEIGPVIGAHSGPGTVALFYFADSRN